MRMTRLIGLSLGALALIAGPMTAGATPPATSTSTFTSSQTDRSLCGFPIVLTFSGTFTERDFFDAAGQLAAVEVHSPDVLTVDGPNGTTVSGHEVINIRVDIDRQTEQHAGVPIHVNGLLMEAGRVFIDADGNVTMSGRFQVINGDTAAFCAALA